MMWLIFIDTITVYDSLMENNFYYYSTNILLKYFLIISKILTQYLNGYITFTSLF